MAKQMHPLIKFLNELPTTKQAAFAAACDTSVNYLRKACSKKQTFGAEICVAIERESGGVIDRKTLRPLDWKLIWPELIEMETAKPKRKKRAA